MSNITNEQLEPSFGQKGKLLSTHADPMKTTGVNEMKFRCGDTLDINVPDPDSDKTLGMTEEELMDYMNHMQEESNRKCQYLDYESMIPSIIVQTRSLFDGSPQYRTFGQKTMGVTFIKPSDGKVPIECDVAFRLSMLYAEIADILNDFREGKIGNGMGGIVQHIEGEPSVEHRSEQQKFLASIAITEAQTAQMWAAKAVAYKD